MTGRGKTLNGGTLGSGREKGGYALRRHKKVLRDNIHAITKPDIRRMARRGGVKRISHAIYGDIRVVMKTRLRRILGQLCAISDYRNRKTIAVMDVVFVLRRLGTPIYGFDQVNACPRGNARHRTQEVLATPHLSAVVANSASAATANASATASATTSMQSIKAESLTASLGSRARSATASTVIAESQDTRASQIRATQSQSQQSQQAAPTAQMTTARPTVTSTKKTGALRNATDASKRLNLPTPVTTDVDGDGDTDMNMGNATTFTKHTRATTNITRPRVVDSSSSLFVPDTPPTSRRHVKKGKAASAQTGSSKTVSLPQHGSPVL